MSGRGLRAAVIGAVESSAVAARRIAKSGVELVGIAGHEPDTNTLISGAYNLRQLAEELEVDFIGFTRVNDEEVVDKLRAWDIDFLFIVGLSQLVSSDVRATARRGSVGYHPTALPKGRGRAPVAWIVLGEAPGASTLFEIAEHADSGGILEQVAFQVTEEMDAADVLEKCLHTLAQAMDQLLPKLERLEWSPVPQDHSLATYLGKRDPGDGLINWNLDAEDIDALIRATAPPHPGAYVYCEGQVLRILNSSGVVNNSRATGVIGKVVRKSEEGYEVQCGKGLLRIREVYDEAGKPVQLREGSLLTSRVEDDLHTLKRRVHELEVMVSRLASKTDNSTQA